MDIAGELERAKKKVGQSFSSDAGWTVCLNHAVEEWTVMVNEHKQLATFGAGCFWGTEKYFAKDFTEKFPGAILGTSVGFMSLDPKSN